MLLSDKKFVKHAVYCLKIEYYRLGSGVVVDGAWKLTSFVAVQQTILIVIVYTVLHTQSASKPNLFVNTPSYEKEVQMKRNLCRAPGYF